MESMGGVLSDAMRDSSPEREPERIASLDFIQLRRRPIKVDFPLDNKGRHSAAASR